MIVVELADSEIHIIQYLEILESISERLSDQNKANLISKLF